MVHDQELISITSANARVAAAFRRFSQAACLAALLFPATLSAEGVDSHAYRLAPGDRITVTVFGQPELSGDVLIDDAGAITIPLTDPIEVKDVTLLECQKRIVDRLADGILRKPSVSVRIAELRPISVLGDVRLPGAYPFRYGSTIQSAVALAGGFGPGELLRNTAVSEFLLAEERVSQLTLQKRTLLVRKARLEAQRDGQDTFSPPAFSDADDDKDTIKIVANERDIFATRGAILRDQIDLLRSEKPHLQEQIEANTKQGDAGKKQLDLIQQQIERYEKLFKQGLGTQNNDFQYRVLEANQEASVWRLLSDISRLQMQSGELDFKIQEVEAAFKRQVATELQETRDRLNELEVTLPAAIRIRDVKLQYAGGAAAQGSRHLISITRARSGHPVVLDASETTPVEPGDVINVQSEMPHVLQHDEAAAGPLTLQSYKMQETQSGETLSPISR
ncbi:polysaccharide export outer membrane protein [Bradyrhizobium lablabi]|uniref:Polysaccharide export outer membrane protein n=1 Tax=Bradyrhizobium lablabi TaxID=722472 RepID=A0A1M6JCF0_9BRAD|nr:polysaccharide biosynthesis/export family protein [Bradyrhizobium lablabi]SHJ44310.1 polysaccharide export outer membrane protein [Bradyrhizobium lablabi]